MGRLFLLTCVATVFLLPGRPASAQVLYGSAVGQLEDQTGAPVPSALVTLVNKATEQTRETKTDADGRYSIVNVLPGAYELNVAAAGFRKFTQTGVEITINNVTRLDVKLEIGQMTEQVTVSASATSHVELDAKVVTNLPLGNYRYQWRAGQRARQRPDRRSDQAGGCEARRCRSGEPVFRSHCFRSGHDGPLRNLGTEYILRAPGAVNTDLSLFRSFPSKSGLSSNSGQKLST